MSISFDRAAPYYDRTRALDQATMARLVPMVVSELGRDGPVLEIGIGTGRIALPLVGEGLNLVGVDISREMLARLRENARGLPPPVAIADATRLPFADHTFAGAIAAHVLHLIPRWKDAVGEITRVVRSGGVFIASRGGRTYGGEWWSSVRREFFRNAGNPAWPPGMDRIEELDEEMALRGAGVRLLPEIAQPESASVNELLELLEQGVWSACWSLDAGTRRRAAQATRAWATEHVGGDLDEPRSLTEVLAWRSYRLP